MKKLAIAASAALLFAVVPASAHEEAPVEEVMATPSDTDAVADTNQEALAPAEHGGGLDKYGCHKNHSTGDYHCHR